MEPDFPFTITSAAALKAAALLRAEGATHALRLRVSAGGCAGLNYDLFFCDQTRDGDLVTFDEPTNLRIVTDVLSAPYVLGAQIDYHDTIEKQGFVINNPTATSTCACGDSFN